MFSTPPNADALPVIDWITTGDGTMVYGGTKLCAELFGSGTAIRTIRAWVQAGRALRYEDKVVDKEAAALEASGLATSNDCHVLALAKISGARVLYSKDCKLHADFKAVSVIGDRGFIYQNPSHASGLAHSSSCRIARSKS